MTVGVPLGSIHAFFLRNGMHGGVLILRSPSVAHEGEVGWFCGHVIGRDKMEILVMETVSFFKHCESIYPLDFFHATINTRCNECSFFHNLFLYTQLYKSVICFLVLLYTHRLLHCLLAYA